jgi:glycosyltransferase involved in cell wall biosynthesis
MKLSVIVPVYNDNVHLDRCLEHIRRSVFRDYECIVVDDASTEDTAPVATRHGATLLRLATNGGPARARNRGVEAARGEIVLFIDADVCVHPDTLGRVVAHFAAHSDTDAVMGSYDDAPFDHGYISQYKNLFHHYIHQRSRSDAWTFWAGCGAIRRSVFLAAGGFDESYARPCIEDIELGFRLRQAGRRIDLNSAIQVTHLKRWTLRSLVRTDLFDRGIPWFLLMLRNRTMPADLNVTRAHRFSVVLVFALLLLGSLAAVGQVAGVSLQPPLNLLASGRFLALAGASIAAGLVLLNLDLYRFFTRTRGLWFTLRALPLHWLYYAYCGLAVVLGLTIHLSNKLLPAPPRAPVEGNLAEL